MPVSAAHTLGRVGAGTDLITAMSRRVGIDITGVLRDRQPNGGTSSLETNDEHVG